MRRFFYATGESNEASEESATGAITQHANWELQSGTRVPLTDIKSVIAYREVPNPEDGLGYFGTQIGRLF